MSPDKTSKTEISPSISFQEVKSHQITPQSKSRSDVNYLSRTKDHTPEELHASTLLYLSLQAELRRIEPNERIKKAIEFGKKLILQALGKDYELNQNLMKVIFLSPEDYKELTKRDTEAFMAPGMSEVIVKFDNNSFDFSLAIRAFHELVHRWVEMQYHVFHETSDETLDIRVSTFETRRQGLQVSKLLRNPLNGEIIGTELLGELTNELGNIAWQHNFFKKLSEDTTFQALFKDEFLFRELKLQELFGITGKGNITMTTTDENRVEHSVLIDYPNLFWDKTGKLEISSITLIYQLVDELSSLIKKVGQLNFISSLISLKTRPQSEYLLRNTIDREFGIGFYKRLRRTNYHSFDSILELLEEVQKRTLKSTI